MNKNYLIIAMVLLLVLVGIALGYSWYTTNNPSFSGSLITPAKAAADFSLTSQTGETVRLSDFLGKYVLIFFGFTHCDSECPLTMGYMKQMRDRLGPLADQVQVLLITSDPARDTPEVLGEYLNHFDPSFVGLTSTPDKLETVWKDYGVTVMDDGETHSSYLYLIDPQGNLIATYPLLQSVDGITADMENLIEGQ